MLAPKTFDEADDADPGRRLLKRSCRTTGLLCCTLRTFHSFVSPFGRKKSSSFHPHIAWPRFAMDFSPCPADGALADRLSCAASLLVENKSEYLGPLLEQGYVLVWIAICTVIVHWIVKKVTPPENDAESWNGFVKSTYGDERDQAGKT